MKIRQFLISTLFNLPLLAQVTQIPGAVGGGGGSVTAGSGIVVAGSTVSVDTAVIQSRAALQAGTTQYCRSTTGNDTYVCALTPALTAYTRGGCLVLDADTANTGAATLNVDTLGAQSILGRAGGALSNGDITANKPITLCFDGTQFIVQGDGGGGGGGATTTTLYKRITFGSCDQSGGFNFSWSDNFGAGTAPGNSCPSPSLMAYRTWSNSVTNTHYVVLLLPDNWNSGAAINMKFRSWMGSGSGNVRWDIATRCYADGEDWTAVTGFNAAQQTSTLAYDGTNNTGTTTLNSVTTTGCVAGETMVFRIERDNAVGGNLATVANIAAVEIAYGITL
jgi:hypothetical protein